MQVCKRLFITKRPSAIHFRRKSIKKFVAFSLKHINILPKLFGKAFILFAFIHIPKLTQKLLFTGWRQPLQGKIKGIYVKSALIKVVLALIIEHLACFIRKFTVYICLSLASSGLHIKAPALTKSF